MDYGLQLQVGVLPAPPVLVPVVADRDRGSGDRKGEQAGRLGHRHRGLVLGQEAGQLEENGLKMSQTKQYLIRPSLAWPENQDRFV